MSAQIFPLSLSRSSLLAEWRALGAITRKEWIIFRRYPTWIIALFIWPIVFPAMYILGAHALAGPTGNGLQSFVQAAGTDNFLGFIVIGTTVWMWQNTVLWNVGYALRSEQMRGTLEANWLTPTFRFSLLVGNSLVQFLSMFLYIVISLLEYILLFGLHLNGNVWLALLVLLFSLPSIYGLGFAFASLVITAKEANGFVFLVRGLVMIFCGISYPLSVMPGWMQSVAQWLPQTYIMRAARGALLTGADFSALWPDLMSLALFGALWLVIGYTAFVFMDRRARQTGVIGQY